MREQDDLIGVKRAIPDARGNWQPLPAYEGWTPGDREFSSWWLVAGAALAVLAAVGAGL